LRLTVQWGTPVAVPHVLCRFLDVDESRLFEFSEIELFSEALEAMLIARRMRRTKLASFSF
jgi:hypothetical protein